MTDDSRKIPTHEVIYARLRDMILFGVLEPGQPVTIQGLTAGLEAGMTPVREAIRRLAAEGALLPQGNRRVAVPRLTTADLEQVAFARLTIEPHLAQLAMPAMTAALIARLEAIDAAVDAAIRGDDIHGYLQNNHAFHFALYEAAGPGVLLDMARSLWLRFGPSLRVVSVQSGAMTLPDAHKEALAMMRTGNAAGLAEAMRHDIAQGVDMVRMALVRGAV